jgi:Suppressor of fused protein (SUFU)
MVEERARGGGTIKRYGDANSPDTAPPERPTYFADILAHLEPFLGAVDTVYDEVVSDKVHLDVLVFAPNDERPCWTLVSCGMSTRRMAAPQGASCERAELLICLPPDWFGPDLDKLARDGKAWPIEILKYVARFPHLYDTWLWIGHTLATAEPPEPFNTGTQFCAFFVAVPLGWPEEKWKLIAHDGQPISFLTIIPLYADELRYARDNGRDALFDRLDEACVNELLDPTRSSLVPAPPLKQGFKWPNLLFRKTRG